MAIEILSNAVILAGGYDISGQSNKVTVNYSVAPLNATVFGNTTTVNAPGITEAKIDAEGFWATGVGSLDERFFTGVGQLSSGVPVYQPIIVGPRAGVEGLASVNPFYAMNGMIESYNFFGAHGVLTPYQASLLTASTFARGANIISGSKVAPGSGTAYQLGAVSATQRLYACLQVPEFVGTTVTFTLESDTTSFPSATSRIAFTAVTAPRASQWAELAGPITDDFWRVTYAGTFTSFTAYLVVAILNLR